MKRKKSNSWMSNSRQNCKESGRKEGRVCCNKKASSSKGPNSQYSKLSKQKRIERMRTVK